MITIHNTTKNIDPTALCTYAVEINGRHVATFNHAPSSGIGECVKQAAMALEFEYYRKVYQVLVQECGADENDDKARTFAHAHAAQVKCSEFRFQGGLGFGGKYRSKTNTVDYYPEDRTEERDKMVERTNNRLKGILL